MRAVAAVTVGLVVVTVGATASAQTPATRRYVVREGDTCVSIARRFYRSATRTDVVHASNPQLGPTPHRLRVGMVLTLPVRVQGGRGPVPVAFVTGANNRVEVRPQPTDEGRPAHRNDPLFLGARVSTSARSSAEVTFADETRLRLEENSLVVILGDTNTRVRRRATASDTTLVSGSLRTFLTDLSAAPASAASSAQTVAVATRARARRRPQRRVRPRATTLALRTATGGSLVLGEGETEVTVRDGETTLSVFTGSSRLRSGNRTVTVRAGYAVRAERGRAPSAPRLLPSAPVWVEAPPGVTFIDGDAVASGATITAEFGAGVGEGRPAAAQWRVQLARDPSFVAMQVDANVPLETHTLRAERVAAGSYFARVSARDHDGFEGPFGPVARIAVVYPRWVPAPRAHRAALELPTGVYCSVDDGPFVSSGGRAPELDRLTVHSLRCSLDADGSRAAVMTLSAERRAPFTVVSRLIDVRLTAREGKLRVRLVDAAGVLVDRPPGVTVSTGDSVTVGRVVSDPGGGNGVWSVPLQWRAGAGSVRLRFSVGDERVDTESISLPEPPPPPPRETVVHRFWLHGELLGAALLSGYQHNTDPRDFFGNTPSMDFGLGGVLHLGFDLRRPTPRARGVTLGAYAGVTGVVFPRPESEAGVASVWSAGLRLGWRSGRWQPWLGTGAGVVFTGGLVRPGFEAAVGLDVRLSRALSLGPVVRYVQIFQSDGGDVFEAIDEDARVLSVGLGLTLRVPSPEE